MEPKTMIFSSLGEKDMKKQLNLVYDALKEKGYNPINQMVGYLLSGDPAYITTHNKARKIISSFDRNDIIDTLLTDYLDKKQCDK